jgi:PAS domain S-box-containing protein
MNTTQQTGSLSVKRPGSRPTIGLLIPDVATRWGQLMWQGVEDASRARDVNLICFPGRGLSDTVGYNVQANVLYDMADAETLDGLVVEGGLGRYIGRENLEAFLQRYRPLPMIVMTSVSQKDFVSIPRLLTDDYQSMREAIVHLVETHHFRRIALVDLLPKIKSHAGYQTRHRAYVETLKEYGLPFDSRLIIPGESDPDAVSAQQVLAECGLKAGIDFEAAVSSNDDAALWFLRGLQSQGIRVPEDVALTGYDNVAGSGAASPPLTTIMPAWYDQGRQAIETILALIEGQSVSQRVVVPGNLVVRQSCGCVNPLVARAKVGPITMEGMSFAAAMTGRRDEIVSSVVKSVGENGRGASREQVAQLLEAFCAEMKEEAPGVFITTLEEVLRHKTATAEDLAVWQDEVSELRRQVLPYLGEGGALLRAEDLWQQGRVTIGEAARRLQAHQGLQAAEQTRALREIEAMLITTFDVAELMSILARELPRFGIPSCYLALYEDAEKSTEWSRLMLAFNAEGQVKLEADRQRFISRRLLPEGMLSQERRVSFVVEPLYFQENQLGFALFEVGPSDGPIYDVLRGEISSALQGALLVQRIQERSAELARQQYILDSFMDNIPDYIYFKDLDSRITRANRAHAAKLGLSDPAEEVGKSDFDFFPEEQARPKYEQEQAIIRSGRPVLNLEEPDGVGHWALTTKMPLRDEHGVIIGTFGISRDITPIKQAGAALEKAYAEVEEQVKQRTVELQQEITERRQAQEALAEERNLLRTLIDNWTLAI